jgi:hypothetical protein
MSLVAFAIRVTTVRALQAALPASIDVVDSPQEPVTAMIGPEPHPMVAIYSGSTETKLDGRNLLGGESKVALAIQFLLPEAFDFTVAPSVVIRIDTRRQGAETALDVLWRMAALALDGKTAEPWAALWREFVVLTPRVSNASYLIEREGVRITAREVVITCDPIHEPTPGVAPEGPWATLLTLMRADTNTDGLVSLADWIEAEIRGGADLAQEERDRIYMGLSDYVARDIGVLTTGPYEDVNNDPLATADDEAPADPDSFTEQDQ